MGLSVAEMAEVRETRESLIETKYVGSNPDLKKTTGEAFLDVPNNQWKYRPFGTKKWLKVAAKELDCANDSGWVRGEYSGPKSIGREGKAYWSELEDTWVYKPKGGQKTFVIPEGEFKIIRDKDVY